MEHSAPNGIVRRVDGSTNESSEQFAKNLIPDSVYSTNSRGNDWYINYMRREWTNCSTAIWLCLTQAFVTYGKIFETKSNLTFQRSQARGAYH